MYSLRRSGGIRFPVGFLRLDVAAPSGLGAKVGPLILKKIIAQNTT